MSDGGQDRGPVRQEDTDLVDGFLEKHAEFKSHLESLAGSSQSSVGSPGSPAFPGPDLARFLQAYADSQARILDFLRAHLESRKAFETLASEKAALQSELARFSEQVMILSKAALDASEEKGRLALELENARKEAGESRGSADSLLGKIQALETELNETRSQLAHLEGELDPLLGERDSLREQLESLSADRQAERAKLEGIEATERNLAEARRELEETRAKIADLETRLGEVRSEDDNLRQRVEQFESENRFSRERNQTLEAELERLRGATVPRTEIDRLQIELSGVRAERDALLDQGKSQIERILSLEKGLDEVRADLEESRSKQIEAEKAREEVESRLRLAEAQVNDLQQAIGEAASDRVSTELPEGALPGSELSVFDETEISMFQSDPDKIQSLALSEDRQIPDPAWSGIPTSHDGPPEPELIPEAKGDVPDSLVEVLDSNLEALDRAQGREKAPIQDWDKDDSIFDEIFKDAFPNEPRESVEGFRAAVETDPAASLEWESPARIDPNEETRRVEADAASEFPYPEITGAGMENFRGKRVLLIGGDERFLGDYRRLFGLSSAELVYFPSFLQLERNGVKRHVRECDVAVVFGAASEDPGIFRLRTIAEDYGRLLINHPSSGLVSLYHQLQSVNAEL